MASEKSCENFLTAFFCGLNGLKRLEMLEVLEMLEMLDGLVVIRGVGRFLCNRYPRVNSFVSHAPKALIEIPRSGSDFI